jgi:hypothetical protein
MKGKPDPTIGYRAVNNAGNIEAADSLSSVESLTITATSMRTDTETGSGDVFRDWEEGLRLDRRKTDKKRRRRHYSDACDLGALDSDYGWTSVGRG